MMTDTRPDKDDANQRKMRKLIVSLLIGAVIGVAGSAGIITLLEASSNEGLSASNTFAATIGVIYVIIGVGVGFGALRPALGERYLNVEDAEELQDSRPMLIYSSIAMTLFGVALIALAFAAPTGPFDAVFALGMAGLCLVLGCWFGWLSYKHSDELMAAVNTEGSSLSFMLMFVALGGWTALAHTGVAIAPTPIDILTMFYVVSLFASFVTIGRRGMMAAR